MRSFSMTVHDDGTVGTRGLFLIERGKRGLQARHADGEAGRRHLLAGEAGDEIVVAPAAADRAEAHRAPLSSFTSKVSSASNTGPV